MPHAVLVVCSTKQRGPSGPEALVLTSEGPGHAMSPLSAAPSKCHVCLVRAPHAYPRKSQPAEGPY